MTAGGQPLKSAWVELYQAGTTNATLIDGEFTDDNGQFEVSFADAQPGRFLYLVVSNGTPGESDLVLLTVAGRVGPQLLTSVHVNELTTVATVYSLSQFLDEPKIFGASPGLDNAMATVFNLVDGKTGAPGAVVSNRNNGTTLIQNDRSTLALVTLNTLANMVAACATADDGGLTCDAFFLLATPDGGPAPTNTAEAIHNIARNPTALDNEALFSLADSNETYSPRRLLPPDAWVIALHFTEGGFSGPGRMAFDSLGRVWSNNNFALHPPGTSKPGKNIVALSPLGDPILGSPIFGSGLNGSGYGTAVGPDDSIWIASFNGSSISKFTPDGRLGNAWVNNLEVSVVTFVDGGTFDATDIFVDGLFGGWGLAVDSSDRVWVISNNQFFPNADPPRPQIIMLDGTNPHTGNRIGSFRNPALQTLTAVQIDQSGNVWVCNNWMLESRPGNISGGDGLVQFIGLASPVLTPLIGPPVHPSLP